MYNISFGHSWRPPRQAKEADIKHLWEAGKLPSVKYGFYGDELTLENVTREHLLPASQGGIRRFGNIVLASKQKNGARSNFDINEFADVDTVKQYLRQFNEVFIENFNGQKYIQMVKKTLNQLGFKIK